MKNKCVKFFSIISWLIFFATAKAMPDVFFTDSEHYHGAYLSHRFSQNFTKISFKFPADIPGVNLRQHMSFDFDLLKNYIRNTHPFPSHALRREMVFMMGHSYYSRFSAQPFLQELTRVLDGFLALDP